MPNLQKYVPLMRLCRRPPRPADNAESESPFECSLGRADIESPYIKNLLTLPPCRTDTFGTADHKSLEEETESNSIELY